MKFEEAHVFTLLSIHLQKNLDNSAFFDSGAIYLYIVSFIRQLPSDGQSLGREAHVGPWSFFLYVYLFFITIDSLCYTLAATILNFQRTLQR